MKPLHGILLFCLFFNLGFFLEFCFPSFLPLMPNNRATLVWCDEAALPEDTIAWINPLKEEFKKRGYILNTQNKHPVGQSDIVLLARPNPSLQNIRTDKIFVWALESPISLPQPLPQDIQNYAKKIFTWRADLVDNKKTVYLPIVTRLNAGLTIDTAPKHKTVLVAMVARNYTTPGAIYTLRKDTVNWFLNNHPNDFILYGSAWGPFQKSLSPKQKENFATLYKGYASDKYAAVQPAKFALAYENTSHTDYVTEKIYDVMQSGTVPVYFGAPNITDYVPANCFVNKRDFPSYEALYTFLKEMPEDKYRAYLTCIQDFLHSDKIHTLTGAYTARRIADEIFKSVEEK